MLEGVLFFAATEILIAAVAFVIVFGNSRSQRKRPRRRMRPGSSTADTPERLGREQGEL